jgi:hypothetical protein
MKKNLVLFGALIMAIVFSSFTVVRVTNYYLVYNGGITEKSMSSFNTPTTTQPLHVNGTGSINWFRVVDQDGDGVEQTEFDTDFEKYDKVSTSSNLLSDETIDVTNELDIKN